MAYPLKDEAVHEFGEALHNSLMELPESEAFKKAKANMMESLWDEIQCSVIDRMPEAIEGFVRGMAGNVVEQILEGREDQMRRYLGLDGYTGRHEEEPTYGAKKGVSQAHPVIHGELFECGAIALRRKIADAHADLIKNERILDLEDQVASLVAQVAEKELQLEAFRRERVGYA